MSWDAHFGTVRDKLPTRQEMIDKGLKIKEINGSEFCYIPYINENGIEATSGFFLTFYDKCYPSIGHIGYWCDVFPFLQWLWDNFRTYFWDEEIQYYFPSFECEMCKDITDEDWEKMLIYDAIWIAHKYGFYSEDDPWFKENVVTDEEFCNICRKYFPEFNSKNGGKDVTMSEWLDC